MSRAKAVLLAGLCSATLSMASCGDKASDGVAEVTTTTTSAASTSEPSRQSTTEPTPETTTTQAPAPATGADSAEAALRQLIEAKGLGQTGRAWDLVLPAQRKLLSRDAYFSCQDPTSFDVAGIEVIDQYPERITVPGLGEQDSVAVTLKLTLASGGQEYSDTDTYHALKENERWYVTVDDENFECSKA